MFWLKKNSTTSFIHWEMKTLKSALILAENLQHVAEITGNWRKASSNHCQLPLCKRRPMQLQSLNLAALNTRTVIFYNKLCVVQRQWPHKTHPDVHKPGGYIAVGVAAIIWNVLSIITCKVNAKSKRGIMLPNISLSLFWSSKTDPVQQAWQLLRLYGICFTCFVATAVC